MHKNSSSRSNIFVTKGQTMEGLAELEALEKVDGNKAWLNCRVALAKVGWVFYSQPRKMNPSTRETVMLL